MTMIPGVRLGRRRVLYVCCSRRRLGLAGARPVVDRAFVCPSWTPTTASKTSPTLNSTTRQTVGRYDRTDSHGLHSAYYLHDTFSQNQHSLATLRGSENPWPPSPWYGGPEGVVNPEVLSHSDNGLPRQIW